jgi:hypothetical protein
MMEQSEYFPGKSRDSGKLVPDPLVTEYAGLRKDTGEYKISPIAEDVTLGVKIGQVFRWPESRPQDRR